MIINPLSRKKFIKNTLLSGILISPATEITKLFAYEKYDAISHREDPIGFGKSLGYSLPIDLILLTATLAPNSHNTQPWKIKKISENAFELYGDPNRLLPSIDPKERQFYHSQGTFLELAYLTADSLMYNANIDLFPKGIPKSKDDLLRRPVARFSISAKHECKHDFLFFAIKNRMMNRDVYSGDYLNTEILNEIQTYAGLQFISAKFQTGEEAIARLNPIIVEAFDRELKSIPANEVTRIWFRLKDSELYQKRDGLCLEGNALSGLKLWFVRNFFMSLDHDFWHSDSTRKLTLDSFRKQVESSKAYVCFISNGSDSQKVWIETGRDFMRFSLACAAKGIAFHTMNQSLQDNEESKGFHEQIAKEIGLKNNQRIQLLARLGRSDYMFSSPRRDLKDILL
ncbi:hypothetical protein LPTSP4_26180 [Leptospira ryugenii]|uniref:Nitroreductase domain-containing protein n=1 Tax=Leptospira ryugenii TaxID=1917863 RepID=A0A2P2E2H9_9LEPT|nr:hypothetical protein [Leptospira ryugenii]GBF51087.1 hypothetical protein LPTSP4_26180 [Leptospira ryugenii]